MNNNKANMPIEIEMAPMGQNAQISTINKHRTRYLWIDSELRNHATFLGKLEPWDIGIRSCFCLK